MPRILRCQSHHNNRLWSGLRSGCFWTDGEWRNTTFSRLETLRDNSDRFTGTSPAEKGSCSHCPDKSDEHQIHFCMAQKGQRLDHLAVQCTWACPEGMHAFLLLALVGVSSSRHCAQRNYVVISSCHVQTPCRVSVLVLPLVSIS